MEIPFSHTVRYTNSGEISISDLGQALVAYDHLFRMLPKVAEQIFPGLQVLRFECEIVSLLRKSPAQEEFAGKFFVRVQESIENYIRTQGGRLGIDLVERHAHGLSLVVVALILLGGLWAYDRLMPDGPPPIHIQGDNNIAISIAGDAVGLSGDELRRAIENALTERDRKLLEKNAVEIVAPAKVDPNASVDFPSVHTIAPATVREFPDLQMLEAAEPDEEFETINDTELFVRATNLDDYKFGWAALINVQGQQWRLRMILPPDADRRALKEWPANTPIRADVIVVLRPGRSGEFEPKVVQVRRIIPPIEGASHQPEGSNKAG